MTIYAILKSCIRFNTKNGRKAVFTNPQVQYLATYIKFCRAQDYSVKLMEMNRQVRNIRQHYFQEDLVSLVVLENMSGTTFIVCSKLYSYIYTVIPPFNGFFGGKAEMHGKSGDPVNRGSANWGPKLGLNCLL